MQANAVDAPARAAVLTVVVPAGLGMFLSTLDTGIVTVALPTLHTQLEASTQQIAWVVTAYVVALSASIVGLGRLADRIGRVRVAASGFVVFGLASAVSALAPTAGVLIGGRALQGLGAAMLQATSQALVTTLLPESQRGRAIGTLGMLIGLGPVAGPTLGGLLLSVAGWPWLFWLNLPLCALALLALRRLHEEPRFSRRAPLDLPGTGLLAAAATGLLLAITLAGSGGVALLPALSAAVLLALLVAHERRTSVPALRPEWFASAPTRAGLIAAGVFGATSALQFVAPPFVLQRDLGFVPWQVGLVSMLGPAGLVLASRVSGLRLSRHGPWPLMVAGMTVMTLALGLLAAAAPLLAWPAIALLLFLYGAGGGLFQPANIAAVMSAAGAGEQATIGAAQRLILVLGIGLGTTLAAALLPVLPGAQAAWLAGAGLAASGFLVLLTARRPPDGAAARPEGTSRRRTPGPPGRC